MDLYHFDQKTGRDSKPLDEKVLLSDVAADNWAARLCEAWGVPVEAWRLDGAVDCGPLFPEDKTPSKLVVATHKPARKKRPLQRSED